MQVKRLDNFWTFYSLKVLNTKLLTFCPPSLYVNKLLKDGFFDCKNSFYVKTFVLLKQWKIRLMNTKRIPQDSVCNFDSDIIWVGLINAYHKASTVYLLSIFLGLLLPLLTYLLNWKQDRTKYSDKVAILLNPQISSFKFNRQKLLHSFCWVVTYFTISFFKFPFPPYHIFWSKNVFKDISVSLILESLF